MVKERVCSSKVGDIDDLKATIPVVISTISREMCIKVINCAVKRYLLCVEHDGEQFKIV